MDVAAFRAWVEGKVSHQTAVRLVEIERTVYARGREARRLLGHSVVIIPRPLRTRIHEMRSGSSPLVSVVVPVYNVEEYLGEAMDSILHQTYRNLEVIAVDDGSTDGSAKILARYAKADPRVRVITKKNAGLGAARNTGTREAKGKYLTFVDSDDFVPRNAYRKMVDTIEKSGSDFVTGVLYRFFGKRKTIPEWTKTAHADYRVGITLRDYHAGIINVYSVNKLYRRTFWDRIGAEFPEGIRYEDQHPITRVMLLADAFDVIPDHVYGYRTRGTGTSISEGKARIEDVLDRVEVVRATGDVVRQEGDESTFVAWLAKCLRYDMMPYITCALAEEATSDYRDAVSQLCALWARWQTSEIVAASSVRFRVIAALAAAGRWSDVRRAAGLYAAADNTWTTEVRDGNVTLTGDFRYEFANDAVGYGSRLSDDDVSVIVAIPSVEATPEALTLRGWAALRNVDSGRRTSSDTVEIVAHLKGTIVEQPLAVAARQDGRLALVWAGAPGLDLSGTAVEARLDLDALLDASEKAGHHRWLFEARLEVAGVRATAAIGKVTGGDPTLKPSGAVHTRSGVLVEWHWDNVDGLTVQVHSKPVAAHRGSEHDALRVQGDLGRQIVRSGISAVPRQALVVTSVGQVDSGVALRGVAARGSDSGVPLRVTLTTSASMSASTDLVWNGAAFTAVIPLSDVVGHDLPNDRYEVTAVASDGHKPAIMAAESLDPGLPTSYLVASHRVIVSRDARGCLMVSLEAPLRDDERGPVAQRMLQEEYLHSEAPLRDDVALFHAYLGEHATDSSLAISEYLLQHRPDITVVWATSSGSVAVPEGAHRVILNSRQWYRTLATARYLVHNIFFDPWFSLKEGQVFLQTWHGTPLKTILSSAWRGMGVPEEAILARTEQSSRWSYLVSPSPYFSELVAREARFTGPVVESGYPRNDALVPSEASARRRAEVRTALGVPEGKFAVLYAPTFRERLSRGWKAQMVSFLKTEDFSRELGDDAVLLLRGHGHNARAQATRETDSSVIDVSHHPNITELMLAADVIVTDYSSLFFDAVAGDKPIVFFVPDLRAYSNSPRGVYLKLEDIAPGPLVKSSRELLRLLKSRAWEGLPLTPAYRVFKATYAPHDDGHASQRVVEAVFGPAPLDENCAGAS